MDATADLWADGALGRNEAIEFLGVKRSTFAALDRDHRFPRKWVGTKPVFAKRALQQFLDGLPDTPPLGTNRITARNARVKAK